MEKVDMNIETYLSHWCVRKPIDDMSKKELYEAYGYLEALILGNRRGPIVVDRYCDICRKLNVRPQDKFLGVFKEKRDGHKPRETDQGKKEATEERRG